MASKRTEPNELYATRTEPQSLNSQLGDVEAILAHEKQYEKLELLNSVDEKLLRNLVEFLQSFHSATVQVSRDKVPTSPDVWPMLLRLNSLCRVSGIDSDSMRELKTSFLSAMEKKYIVHPLHKLATVLNPVYKTNSYPLRLQMIVIMYVQNSASKSTSFHCQLWTTRSSAVAERPRDASCLSVVSFNIPAARFRGFPLE